MVVVPALAAGQNELQVRRLPFLHEAHIAPDNMVNVLARLNRTQAQDIGRVLDGVLASNTAQFSGVCDRVKQGGIGGQRRHEHAGRVEFQGAA